MTSLMVASYTTKDVAALAGISPHTVRRWADAGILGHVQWGRNIRFSWAQARVAPALTAMLKTSPRSACPWWVEPAARLLNRKQDWCSQVLIADDDHVAIEALSDMPDVLAWRTGVVVLVPLFPWSSPREVS